MAKETDTSMKAAWIATALFTIVYVLHSVDRFVISVVIEPIRHEFGLTDTQLGALGGIAHAIAYSVFVLPVGWLLDRTNRVRLLTVALALWSGLTMLGALASGYWHLFLMRMGVGAAEAATSPSVQSLVASLFPPKMRASAMGVVFSGVAIGTGLIFAIGGVIAHAFGWRYVFLVAGLPGLLLAIIMWAYLKEPPRRTPQGSVETPPSMREALLFVAKTPPIWLSAVGLTLASMSVASVWTWITPILVRHQGFSLAQAGMIVGVSAGVVKFGSTFFSGFLSDWIAKGRVERLWIVPSTAMILSLPAAAGVAFAPAQWLVIACVMLLGLTLGTHYSAPRAVIVSVAPERMRGSVASIEQLVVNLLGAGMGPLVTGVISDQFGGENSVGLALVATLSINLVAALCFALSARGARDAEGDAITASAATH
ncbi:MFS transporter [Sphingobium sp.]|uniref:spinster family MFS transporter n=1 Tax=Sphingobium sp. TaxID=1912891 RepID=UPI0026147B23|nr:MFS transporter [Sphingobium sp.]